MVVKDNSIAVLGYHDSTAGHISAWLEDVTPYHIACFVHEASVPLEVDVVAENKKRVSQRTEYPLRNSFRGKPLIVSLDWIDELKKLGIKNVLPLTSDNRARLGHIELCQKNGMNLVSVIHPTAIILHEAIIHPGVWINAGSLIGYKAEIHSGAWINTRAQIDHHNVLESCCQVDPGVITAGYVTLRKCSHVHSGAVVINRKEVGEDAIIGAGAVVITDIPPKCTAVGVPAKVIKYH